MSRSVDQAARVVEEFVQYLASFGAQPKPSSELRKAVDAALSLPAAYRAGVRRADETPLTVDRPALAAVALAGQVLRARGTSLEGVLKPRLKAMSKGVPVPLPSDASSSARNSVLETVAACGAATFAQDVEFAEPDVCCKSDGVRWGIAAKVAYGSDETVADRVNEGRDQVAKQVAADRLDNGIVLLDMTNLMPDLLLRFPADPTKWASFVRAEDVQRLLHDAHEERLNAVLRCIRPHDPTEPTVAIVTVAYCYARLRGVPTIARQTITRIVAKQERRASGLVVVTTDVTRAFVERLVDGLRV